MRIVIDTKSWHPIVQFIAYAILVNIVVTFLAWAVEYYTGWNVEFWRGYAIGALITIKTL